MSEEPAQARYRRSQRLLWRVLPGMVLTQRIDGDPGAGVVELTGMAAMAWAVLDEPAGAGEIAQALEIGDDSAMQQALVEALAQLVEAGLVVHR